MLIKTTFTFSLLAVQRLIQLIILMAEMDFKKHTLSRNGSGKYTLVKFSETQFGHTYDTSKQQFHLWSLS